MNRNALVLRERATIAARHGRVDEAASLHDRAIALAPDNGSILNSAAYFWSQQGDYQRAIALLRRAVAAEPIAVEPLLNLATLLNRSGAATDAWELIEACEEGIRALPRYWSIRAAIEAALGRKRDSLSSYEAATRLDPANLKAAHGRARMALETGRAAASLFEILLKSQPGDEQSWLGYAQALDAEGRSEEARSIATNLVAKTPGWPDALELLAQLRWASGEREHFADHYAEAARRSPSPDVYTSWCRTLAGVDRFIEAAVVAAQARASLGDPPLFALLEAVRLGEAGDDERAGDIFAELGWQSIDRRVHEARHWLRIGEPARAEALTAGVIGEVPDHVGAWALRDIAWRLADDPRHEWLHGQPGFIGSMEFDLDDDRMRRVIAFLDELHDRSAMPVGQSVRDGSQTRGGLFDRHEPEARWIEESFRRVAETYRAALPPRDDTHPLLRHRDSSWRIAGSWSIRVFSGGRHTEHIHPSGLISSASYFTVPPAELSSDPRAGWLELGRPPPDLRLDLQPLFGIQPTPGRCALFPSTLYHGTRRFSAGKRMTAAIDIQVDSSK